MPCIHLPKLNAILTVGGPIYTIVTADRVWRFEHHDYCGPSLVDRHGELLKNPWPSERSSFWKAIELWIEQGKRIVDGRCQWVPKPKPRVELVGGRWFLCEAVTWSPSEGRYIVRELGVEDVT